MKLIIFGPQGSGKGTQAELIASRQGFAYVSTGDLFRKNLKGQTALGQQVKKYLNDGLLVPDELTNQVVANWLAQLPATQGFVLDGYPRTQQQLDFLQTITPIDWALLVDLTDQQAVDRLAGRLACQCGLSYHLQFNPPKKPGICDSCGQDLFRRADDQPEVIAKRLAIYHQETEPILDFFRRQGKLKIINGNLAIEVVHQAIVKALGLN